MLASRILLAVTCVLAPALLLQRVSAEGAAPAAIAIDYPLDGSLFPPDIVAPTFLFRDASDGATAWRIDVAFVDGAPGLHIAARAEPMRVGEIDARCVTATNKPPELTPQQAASRTWRPDPQTWAAIRQHSVTSAATVTIVGMRGNRQISRGHVAIRTSRDPVGAPIFYRDVPLMPSETKKGVIKPLSPEAIPLIAWRLRNIAEPRSHVVMEHLPTCANCHSFSADGKTVGMDLDGPDNDKGLYALVDLKPRTVIRAQDLVSWNRSADRQFGQNRVGFMSQLSPDGQYVLTTISGTSRPLHSTFYVVNFKDYRFLQVFYPTGGILAWYDRATGIEQPLPGAENQHYVQTDGVWSPDGKYVVFARTEAKSAYPPNGKLAEFANDPNEVPLQYDLYRVPFNNGRGGIPEPIAGASQNGMSNTFPKVSPDGRWIVFVQCRNGQLMRPDSQLYIVPAQGGEARRMRCNTPLMNSWHSFSPNGRWLVFSSKARSPYTQMYLTHIDEQGNDSPPILIENSTAANRAVNLPEFVNITPDRVFQIDLPVLASYAQLNDAADLASKGRFDEAIAEWEKALASEPGDARAHNNLGVALAHQGRYDEAIPHYEKALELDSQYVVIHFNLGRALAAKGRLDEAIAHLETAVEHSPDNADVHQSLGQALMAKGQLAGAFPHFESAVKIDPNLADAHYFLGLCLYFARGDTAAALAQWHEALRLAPDSLGALNRTARVLAVSLDASLRNGAEAVDLARRAAALSKGNDPVILDTLAAALAEQGSFAEAVVTARRALDLATRQNNAALAGRLREAIATYEARNPWRESPQ
jgi:tetratricopeptide (TPR) repeat protein